MKKIIQVKSDNPSDYISVSEASEILNIKEGVIRNYLSTGKFITYKFRNRTLLSRLEVEDWKDRLK